MRKMRKRRGEEPVSNRVLELELKMEVYLVP